MADDIIKHINPNIGAYNNLDALNTKSVAVKDFNSDAMLAAIQSLVSAGLAHYALVTNVPNVTSFRASALIGMGSTFFRNWYAYVLWDAAGLGAAPQDEYRVITAFNSADATFTHIAYSATLTVGDKVLLIHPWLAGLLATSVGKLQSIETNINLNQAAGNYLLFTGTAQDVIVEKLVISMPNIVAGGALTSISIQTNDATPQVFIDNVLGAVANLTAEAQLAWTGAVTVHAGKLIRLTINGGAHGVAYLCNTEVQYRTVVIGGLLV